MLIGSGPQSRFGVFTTLPDGACVQHLHLLRQCIFVFQTAVSDSVLSVNLQRFAILKGPLPTVPSSTH